MPARGANDCVGHSCFGRSLVPSEGGFVCCSCPPRQGCWEMLPSGIHLYICRPGEPPSQGPRALLSAHWLMDYFMESTVFCDLEFLLSLQIFINENYTATQQDIWKNTVKKQTTLMQLTIIWLGFLPVMPCGYFQWHYHLELVSEKLL